MTFSYKMEEHQIKDVIDNNIGAVNPSDAVKFHIFVRNKKLKNLVMENRCHKPDQERHVVYNYTCNLGECISSETYIGYTESILKERIRNHGQHGSIIKYIQEK